ncbi:hypothetical protein HN51_009752 [Arachis hypogaea]|uniref:DUF6821 domain-containing protein n=2 Tax=Arachis TaxID=3817 RepID=A0A445CY21_ARAHY|nr:uncharacterized protein LOC107491509 [Arachis duranensis]XP_025702422.1 uncharacterized protein LOC112803138 [Arachis hypogaea]QHO44297.1 uncharacterized protein DS421_5g170000 [Arachis hypogaea]RYR55832.1 hypothetical protein Ahy_A05g021697 [Arachis hypogaea]
MDPQAEAMEWELLHHSADVDDDNDLDLGPQLEDSALIRPNHFSIQPPTPVAVSCNSSSSSTDPNEVDRNFDDTYLADQLYPQFLLSNHSPSSASSSTLQPLPDNNDSDSDSDAKTEAHVNKEEDEEEQQGKEIAKEEEEETRVAWWKVPLEVFKYWVVRVSPIPAWSLSVAAAAAFFGLVILGRRLYKMKRKTQSLKLNVALDDKKASQLMGRVARLNEAFSVVRRVPIVRPSLPAPSVTLSIR